MNQNNLSEISDRNNDGTKTKHTCQNIHVNTTSSQNLLLPLLKSVKIPLQESSQLNHVSVQPPRVVLRHIFFDYIKPTT